MALGFDAISAGAIGGEASGWTADSAIVTADSTRWRADGSFLPSGGIDNPPGFAGVAAAQAVIRSIWDRQPTWPAQTMADSAGIAYVPPVAGVPPPRSNVIARTIADAWNDYTVTVISVPQTAQAYAGDTPIPNSIALDMAIRASWDSQPNWSAQRAPKSLAWNVTAAGPVNDPPFAQRIPVVYSNPNAIYYGGGYQYGFTMRAGASSVAPVTPDNPPPSSRAAQTAIRAIWDQQPAWAAQSEADGAGWNVAAIVANPPPPSGVVFASILAAWVAPGWPAQRAPWLAPLTLIYGQQPPPISNATQVSIRAIWDSQPNWSAQSEADGAAIGYVPPTIGNPPPVSLANQITIRASWDVAPWAAQSETDNAGWNPPVQTLPPSGPYFSISLLANVWAVTWSAQRAAPIAGLIAPNDPPRSSWVNQRTIAEQWVRPWHFAQGATKIAGIMPIGGEVPPRIIVTPNADRSVKPSADRILIVYAPRTVL